MPGPKAPGLGEFECTYIIMAYEYILELSSQHKNENRLEVSHVCLFVFSLRMACCL